MLDVIMHFSVAGVYFQGDLDFLISSNYKFVIQIICDIIALEIYRKR